MADMSDDSDVFVDEEIEDSISIQMNDFGCHLEWKELKNIDRLTLVRCQDVLKGETWHFEDRPTYFTSVRNLQGFIAYNLDEEEEAEDFFNQVLRHDPDNINALGNMMYMLKAQCRYDGSKDYEVRLRAIFEGSKNRATYSESYPQRARAYADRAHAIRYFEQDKRCFHYMTYVERAATIGKLCHDAPHRSEWFFDHALALYRRDVQMLYIRKISGLNVSSALERKIQSGFEKAVKLFHEVIQLSKSKAYLSLSWVFIGILINHDPENRSNASILQNNADLRSMTADDFYKKGLSIHDCHEITTRRVGAEYVKLKRYSEAKELLDRSISILKSWFAHRYRGVLFLNIYEDDAVKESELAAFGINKRTDLLYMAEKEFEKAMIERRVHADLSDLGQVYHLLGQRKKALTKFSKAFTSEQDDYFDLLETYKRWMNCLGEGHPEIATLEAKAEELRHRLITTPLDTNGDSFSDDFDHYSREELPDHVRLLTEDDFWLASSTGRTRHQSMPYDGPIPRGQYRYDFFLSYHSRDRIWSLALFGKLETEYNLRGCIEQRDFTVGEDRSENAWRCLSNSHRCIVVLSPHYVQCSESQGILRDAMRISYKRSRGDGGFVIPIVLSDCDIGGLDPRLEDVHKVECHLGQIPLYLWQNLVHTVRQSSSERRK